MSQGAPPPRIPDHVPPEFVVDFDIATDEALSRNAFARLREVRDSAPPVAWTPYNGGNWFAMGTREVETVLTDAERFSNSYMSETSQAAGGPKLIPLGMDPPDHLPYRNMLLRYLGPNRVKNLEAAIRQEATNLIAPLAGKAICEFVSDVSEPMPVFIFMELMGLPKENFQAFRALAMQVLSPDSLNHPEKMGMASAQIMGILVEVIAARRAEPRDDLISALIGETINGEPIIPEDLLSVCFMLFLGGLDTVTNAMAYGIRHLAMDKELQRLARENRDSIPALVEKLLRANAFVNCVRLVKQDTELGGARLKAGDAIWALTWPSSNEPGGPTEGQRHTAFGFGHHMCVGMHLARLELRILYETWFDLIGEFSLVPGDPPVMRGGPLIHIRRLPLVLSPTI